MEFFQQEMSKKVHIEIINGHNVVICQNYTDSLCVFITKFRHLITDARQTWISDLENQKIDFKG